MLQTELRILRVFGLTSAEVTGILRAAQSDGCSGLRLLERDGEFAVCVQASAPTQAMAESYCEKWAQKLSAKFGDSLYATGEISLAQATLNALLEKRRLIVAADDLSGRLLSAALQPLNHSEAAFDFGTQTYANPAAARRIVTPAAVMKKFPGDVIQAAASRAQLALGEGGADYAVAYMPGTVGQAPFVLLCDKRGALVSAVSPELSDAAIANHMLDLVRRRALGLHNSSDTVPLRPGRETPLLIVSKEGQGSPLSDTLRFSLRKPKVNRAPRRPAAPDAPDFEPMLDFDANTALTGAMAGASPAGQGPMPRAGAARAAGSIVFEDAAPVPPRRTADAGRQTTQDTPLFDTTPLAGEPAEEDDEPQQPQNARLRERGNTIAIDPEELRQAGREAPRHSILDDEVPNFTSPVPDREKPRTTEDFKAAAHQLFDMGGEAPTAGDDVDAVADPIKNRSLAVIEKSERRQHRTMVLVSTVLAVLLLAGAALLFLYFRNSLGAKPSSRGYGTVSFDGRVADYLNAALEKQENVAGYLALPGAEGALVYTAETPLKGGKALFGGKLAAEAATTEDAAAPVLTQNALEADGASNTVIDCGGQALAKMSELDTLKENAGFTLYTQGMTYRYKVFAVFYRDPAETGSGAFTVLDQGEYKNYNDYMAFVLGLRARTLYDTGIDMPDNARFLTLRSGSGEGAFDICVTGRLIEPNEDAQLVTSSITKTAAPLLTGVQYTSAGIAMPEVSELLAQSMDWYAARTLARPVSAAADAESSASGSGVDTDALTQEVQDMAARTQSVLDAADAVLAGLTDVAGSGADAVQTDITQAGEGTVPEQAVAVPTATTAPTAAPAAEAPTEVAAATEPPAGGSVDTGGATSADGETINVTMNGSQQTLDIVQCLAMIAQNELGVNAPAEAYKAQCVAAHCWILSQGGYPSVSGTDPGEAALAAAREVAHVLITYNGSVCFTPYFASASTGTASSADVWGNDRAWLQAVDSPFDQTVSSNWNTNGNNTGCARFSRATLEQRIRDELQIDLAGVDPNSWFKILSANQYGWVAQMQIGPDGGSNTTSSGRWFRENLLAGQSVDGRSLRSQCFTFTYDAGLDCFIFDVYGYGHGCGMSQWGAVGYANNGWDYQSILTHYYTGTTLTTY